MGHLAINPQTSKNENFATKVNCLNQHFIRGQFRSLTTVLKLFILDVCGVPSYASVIVVISTKWKLGMGSSKRCILSQISKAYLKPIACRILVIVLRLHSSFKKALTRYSRQTIQMTLEYFCSLLPDLIVLLVGRHDGYLDGVQYFRW